MPPRFWVAAGLAAVVLAAAIVVVLGYSGGTQVAGSPVPAGCSNDITVSVDTDAEMQRIADRLRGDRRIGNLTTETQQQAYERFKKEFAHEPELVKLTRPEAMPASVRVQAANGIPGAELTEELRGEFPPPAEVRGSVLPC